MNDTVPEESATTAPATSTHGPVRSSDDWRKYVRPATPLAVTVVFALIGENAVILGAVLTRLMR